MNKRILIVEDEHALAAALAALCRRLGADATLCYSARRALEEQGEFALAIVDIGLPDMSGLKLLEALRERPAAPPVLITGQTGTGKTLAARVIHSNGPRRDAPFITLHCGSLPEPLLESELFGYEKNAFTGALSTKPGHIERATGGTLFLDEIADIPAAIQAKLLRFVEERTFTRIGGREDRTVDLRLITATNRNLLEEVREGRFREDLYYRLHVLEIGLPALNRRREDIPALASVFLAAIAPGRGLGLSPDALALLRDYPWPGNVRQLRNTLEHAVAVSSGGTLFPRHLPAEVRETAGRPGAASVLEPAIEDWLEDKLRDGADYDAIHTEIESIVISHLLKRFDNKPTVLARALNMNRVTLRKKMGGTGPAPSQESSE